MLTGLGLALLALRSGLALRRTRLGRLRRPPALRPAHLRFARPAVVLLLIGFTGGPISALWLRGWEPFETFHGLVGLAAAGLFGAGGWLGHQLATGRSRSFEVHALLGVLGVAAGALAALAGFSLLP